MNLCIITPTAFLLILLSSPLQAAEPPTLVIQGGLLFDPVSATSKPSQAIIIEGQKIKAVGTPDKPVLIPKEARVIDASGKFLCPGLIDAHVHLVHRLN